MKYITLKEFNQLIKTNMRCALCEDKGVIEKVYYICDDSTGYNSIQESTGELVDCPECHNKEYDEEIETD